MCSSLQTHALGLETATVKLLRPLPSLGHVFAVMHAHPVLRGGLCSWTAAAIEHKAGVCHCEQPPWTRLQPLSSHTVLSRVWGGCSLQRMLASGSGGDAVAASTLGVRCHGHVHRAPPGARCVHPKPSSLPQMACLILYLFTQKQVPMFNADSS